MDHALQVLEFGPILERLANTCETSAGAEAALALRPTFDPELVWLLQSETAEAYRLIGEEPLPSLGAVSDLRTQLRNAAKGASLDGESLYRVGNALAAMRSMKTMLKGRQTDSVLLWRIAEPLPELPKIEARLLQSLDGSGEVMSTASPELSRLRKAKSSAAQRIIERIQAHTSGKSRDLLSDPIYTQREGRYVIPLKAEHKGKVRGIVHDTSASGQTVFIEPEDVVAAGNALREAEAAERAEVERILQELSALVGSVGVEAANGISAAADLDLVLARARLGYAMGGCSPLRADSPSLTLRNAKHPHLDPAICVPLTLTIEPGTTGILITGPNTGGKTVAIKTVGLAVAMAQAGLMPVADEVRLGPFVHIWADIGDEQSLQQSLSTFSGHIKNISQAIRELKPGALVLLDEVGAGTDPAEGAALAIAILLELQKRGAKVLASTHYGELKIFAYNTPGFSNAAMEFDLKSLQPTYRLMMGAPGASHAFRIAERTGLPSSVIESAKSYTGTQDRDIAAMLEKLETAQRLAQRAQGEADRLAHRLREVESEAQRKLAQASEAQKTAKQRASEAIEETLRTIRIEAAEIFESLKRDASPAAVEAARQKLKGLQRTGSELAEELHPQRKVESQAINKGDTVRVQGYSQTGVVLEEPRGKQCLVQIGVLKITVPLARLEKAEGSKPAVKREPRKNLGLEKASTMTTEIHLRNMRAEDAEQELEKFLDDAELAGLASVRIVHGKGEGILRQMAQTMLRRHKAIRSYREGEPNEGGQGVTIATLK